MGGLLAAHFRVVADRSCGSLAFGGNLTGGGGGCSGGAPLPQLVVYQLTPLVVVVVASAPLPKLVV